MDVSPIGMFNLHFYFAESFIAPLDPTLLIFADTLSIFGTFMGVDSNPNVVQNPGF